MHRLSGLQVLVLDEGDRLLDAGFQKAIGQIVRKLPRARQSLCFSATMPTALRGVLDQTLRKGYTVVDCIGKADAEQTATTAEQTVRAEMSRDCGKVILFLPTAMQAQFMSEHL